jgi:hypothetical protein
MDFIAMGSAGDNLISLGRLSPGLFAVYGRAIFDCLAEFRLFLWADACRKPALMRIPKIKRVGRTADVTRAHRLWSAGQPPAAVKAPHE